ncbi:MAG: 50S ribosomal protein L22 [Candidatus Wildermuthbacteria bacterium]|nr:50S ribosomal protein L22 [Candidatus Wildermuthbacteria bacterium]
MKSTAILRYLRIAPRKARLVADTVRGKNVEQARALLKFTPNKSARPMLKLLNSAVASALQKFQIEPKDLFVMKITVDEGPKLKRFRPRARGQAYEIQKKTSHITIMLDTKVAVAEKKKTEGGKAQEPIEAKKTESQKAFVQPKDESAKPKGTFLKKPQIFRRKSI